MFCPNCGNKIDDGASFCGVCGSKLSEEKATAEESVQETENAQNNEYTEYTYEKNDSQPENTVETDKKQSESEPIGNETTETFENGGSAEKNEPAQSVFYAPEIQKPKKKKHVGRIVACVLAVIIICAGVLSAVFFPYVSNFARKTFLPADKYMQSLLKNQTKDSASVASELYGKVIDTIWSDDTASKTVEGSVSLEYGEGFETLIPDSEDLSFLNGLNISYKIISEAKFLNPGNAYFNAELNLGENSIASFEALQDIKNSKVYIGLPEMSDKYLGVDLETDDFDVNEIPPALSEKPEFLPTADEINDLIIRYAGALYAGITDVEKSSEDVKVGDISAKYTVLTATVDEKTISDMLENIAEEAKNDKALENIIKGICELAEEEFDYDEIIDSIKEAAEDIKDEDGSAVMKLYVNSKGDIMGSSFEIDEADMEISRINAVKGNKLAGEMMFKVDSDKIVISESGENKDGIISEEAKFTYNKKTLFKINLSDYDVQKNKAGDPSFKISITPEKGFYSLAEDLYDFDMANGIFSMLDIKFEFEAKGKNEFVFDIYGGAGKDNFAKIIVTCRTSEASENEKITFPSAKDVVDASDDDACNEWLQNLDTKSITDRLKDAGVPEEFTDAIKDGINSALNPTDIITPESDAKSMGYSIGYDYGMYLAMAEKTDDVDSFNEGGTKGYNDGYYNRGYDHELVSPDTSKSKSFINGYYTGYNLGLYTSEYEDDDELYDIFDAALDEGYENGYYNYE